MDADADLLMATDQRSSLHRRIDKACRQAARARRAEIARDRQRQTLLKLLVVSMDELGISNAEVLEARRSYRLSKQRAREVR